MWFCCAPARYDNSTVQHSTAHSTAGLCPRSMEREPPSGSGRTLRSRSFFLGGGVEENPPKISLHRLYDTLAIANNIMLVFAWDISWEILRKLLLVSYGA